MAPWRVPMQPAPPPPQHLLGKARLPPAEPARPSHSAIDPWSPSSWHSQSWHGQEQRWDGQQQSWHGQQQQSWHGQQQSGPGQQQQQHASWSAQQQQHASWPQQQWQAKQQPTAATTGAAPATEKNRGERRGKWGGYCTIGQVLRGWRSGALEAFRTDYPKAAAPNGYPQMNDHASRQQIIDHYAKFGRR